jgi:hypothetical protein
VVTALLPLQSPFTLRQAEEALHPPASAKPMPAKDVWLPESLVMAHMLVDIPALAFDNTASEVPWQVQFLLVTLPRLSASATAYVGADNLQVSIQGSASMQAELIKSTLLPSPPQATHAMLAALPPALAGPPAAPQAPAPLHGALAGPTLLELMICLWELGKADTSSYAFLVSKRSLWSASWMALLSTYLAHKAAKLLSSKWSFISNVPRPDCVGHWIRNRRKWWMRPGNHVELQHAQLMGSW